MLVRPSIRASLGRLTVAVAVIIALGLPLAAARAASGPPPGIRVFDGQNDTLALFTSAKCKTGRLGFIAVGHNNGYLLYIRVAHFTGFHRYGLKRGVYTGTFIEVRNPSLQYFASDFIPPYHIPGGGAVDFADHGKRLGGGFYPMFNEAGTDGVGVAGGLTCNYPSKQKARH